MKSHYAIQYLKKGKTYTLWLNSQSTDKEAIIKYAKVMWNKRNDNGVTALNVIEFVQNGVSYSGGKDVQGPELATAVQETRGRSGRRVRKPTHKVG